MNTLEQNKSKLLIDPRIQLLLLITSNIIAFAQSSIYLEVGYILFVGILYFISGVKESGIKWLLFFVIMLLLQKYIVVYAPKAISMSFSLIVTYARKVFPCLMVGNLIIKTVSLKQFTEALRKLHISQKIIIPITVTIRYFPAIREEASYIKDAMRLRNIHGIKKVEAYIVPLMVSAIETSEELSSAAVTRGIENPAPKTTITKLKIKPYDIIISIFAVIFIVALIFFK